MINLSWFAAPILAQRNIELHSIDLAFDEANTATVYTVREATGKIGTFSVPTRVLANAVEKKTVDAVLRPLFESVEFHDAKSAIPEVQQVSAGTPESAGKPESSETPVHADGAASPAADLAGDTATSAKPARGRRKSGPKPAPVDGSGNKPAEEPVDNTGESTGGTDGATGQEESAAAET